MNPAKSDRGSASVEMVLLAPVLVVLALFVVYSGRSGESVRQIQHAADQGARAASQASGSHRVAVAESASVRDLESSGVSCTDRQISVNSVRLGRFNAVRVEVSCSIQRKNLGLLGVNERRIQAESTEVVDHYRAN